MSYQFSQPIDNPFAPKPPPAPRRPENPADFYASQVEWVKSSLAPYDRQIDQLVSLISAAAIADAASEAQVQDLGLTCDKLWKAIESRRKEFVAEPNAFIRSVNNLSKHYQERLDQGRRQAKDKMAVYASAKALEARKAAEAERQARAKIQARLDEEAARLTAELQAGNESAPAVTAPKLPATPPANVPRTIRTAGGSATMVTSWQFEITDPDSVPRQFLKVDETAIRKAVRDGLREIPGVRIFEESNFRFGK